MDFGRFLDVVRAFEHAGVDYVLVGGVAVNLHGIVRATEDIDFFVRSGAGNIDRLRAALRSLWDDPEIDEIRVEDFDVYPTLRYGPPGEGFVIDVLGRLGMAFAFEDPESESLEIEGVRVRVATAQTLIRMKRRAAADRPGRFGRSRAAAPERGRGMTLERFRDQEAARRALWVERGDPDLARRIRSLWAFAERLAPGAAPRGLRKLRTLEEAEQERADWVARRARALRAARLRP